MALKFALLFLCAALFASSQVESASLGLGAGIVDTIKEVVKAIEDWVDKVLPVIQQIVDTMKDDFASSQQLIVKAVTDLANAVSTDLLRVLDDLGKNSTPAGQKLTDCVDAAQPDIVAVFTSLATDLTTCTKAELTSVGSDLAPLVSDLADLQKDVKVILQNLDKCPGNDVTDVLCALSVLGDVVEAVAKQVPTLLADLSPVLADGTALADSAVKCWTDGKPTLLSNGGKVVAQIAACAAA